MKHTSLFPPQRWGVLPTRAFWERPHFWRSARTSLIPLIFLETRAFADVAFRYDGWQRWALLVLGVAVTVVTQGLLERFIRSPGPLEDVTGEERRQAVFLLGHEDEATLRRRSRRGVYGLMLLSALGGALAVWQAIATHQREARHARLLMEIEQSRQRLDRFNKEYAEHRKASRSSPRAMP